MAESKKIHAVFCDDIRHEVNGKTSLIGCYAGMMLTPVFPVTLPRLCVYVQLSTPADQPFEGMVSISVMKDGEVLTRTDFDGAQIIQGAQQNPATPEDIQNYHMITGFEFSPLNIEKPCVLQVIAETKDGVMRGERLRVSAMPEPLMAA